MSLFFVNNYNIFILFLQTLFINTTTVAEEEEGDHTAQVILFFKC